VGRSIFWLRVTIFAKGPRCFPIQCIHGLNDGGSCDVHKNESRARDKKFQKPWASEGGGPRDFKI